VRRWAVAAAVVAAAVVVLLGIAQLALPAIAEHRLRDRLARTGKVERVEIHAFPALKLLWDRADDVTVRMRSARPGPGRLADLLAQTADTHDLDARVARLRVLTLQVRDVQLRKRGSRLTGMASVTGAALRAALPPQLDVRPIAVVGGAIVFQGTADVLGRRLSAQAQLYARDGRVVLAPNIPFGGLLSLTVFSDRRVEVERLAAGPGPGGGFTFTATARVRG
jgi:hypothetical protein